MSAELPRLRKNVATPNADAEMGPTPRLKSPQGPGQRTPAPATAKTPQSVPPPPPQDDAGVTEATRQRVKKVFIGIIVVAALAGVGYAIYSRAMKGGAFGKGGENGPENERIQKKQDELPKFPTCSIQGGFGNAVFYNGLFSGGYYGKNGLVEGRLAIGGNAEVIDWTVGTGLNFGNKCPTPDAKDFELSNYTLIVDGVFTAFRPLVQNGGVAYGIDKGGVGMTATDIGTNCPFVMKKNVLDFINVFGQLQLVDALISQMPGALAYSEVFALTYTMYVNKNAGHQYFVVEEADFLDANYIVLDGELPQVNGTTASVIVKINMDPSNTAKSISLGARGFSGFDAIKDRLIWHFPGYKTITLQNVGWPGAILALDASFENMTGDIYGSVFAKSWNLQKRPDAALHINKFAGTVFGVNCNSTYVKVNGTDSNSTADLLTPTCPLAGNLGIAPNYNGFFSGSYYAINTNVGGRLACGVNINVTNFAAGNNMYSPTLSCPIPGNSATFSFANYALVAMENLTTWNASVFNGGAIYGLYDGNGESFLGVGSGCPKGQIWSGFEFPMDATFSQLNLASSTINSLTGNFSFSSLAGGKYLNLYLNGNTTAEIFHITEADLAACTTVILLGTPLNNNATIVINIKKGSSNGVLSISSKNFIGFSSSLRNYVLWNFNGYSRITLNNFGWPGSILAPTAAFEQMVGQIDGSVFGKSWNQQKNANTAELGYRPFIGVVPTTDCGV